MVIYIHDNYTKGGIGLVKFSIVDLCGNARDIPVLVRELRQKNLISGTEKDLGGETVFK
jgi:squalene cyclase